MSKRFLRWIDSWIEDNVPIGDGADIEPFEQRAKRLAAEILAAANAEGFRPDEIEDEFGKVPGLLTKRLGANVEFDLSTFGGRTED